MWQKALTLVEDVYRLSRDFPRSEVYGLTQQLRRSIVSVPSNIAEGQARQSSKEFRQFLYIAKGSLAESHTQLLIAERLHYVSPDKLEAIGLKITELQKMLHSLIQKLPKT